MCHPTFNNSQVRDRLDINMKKLSLSNLRGEVETVNSNKIDVLLEHTPLFRLIEACANTSALRQLC